MASFGNTGTLRIVRSVSSPDYQGVGDWVLLSEAEAAAAQFIPLKYRKWTGSAFKEMTPSEKDAADAAIEAERIDASASEIVLSDAGRALKLNYAIMWEMAKLHSPAITVDQFLSFGGVDDFTDQAFIDKIKEII